MHAYNNTDYDARKMYRYLPHAPPLSISHQTSPCLPLATSLIIKGIAIRNVRIRSDRIRITIYVFGSDLIASMSDRIGFCLSFSRILFKFLPD